MSLPVSSYEELLARVRSLTSETIQLRHEITLSLCDTSNSPHAPISSEKWFNTMRKNFEFFDEKNLVGKEQMSLNNSSFDSFVLSNKKSCSSTSPTPMKKYQVDNENKNGNERSLSDSFSNTNLCHRRDWGPESLGLWHSGPSKLFSGQSCNADSMLEDCSKGLNMKLDLKEDELTSFSRTYSQLQLDAKVEIVYNLLSLLGTGDKKDMSKTFLAMSSSAESCQAMRQSGCLPLLVQLIHSSELDLEVRSRAAQVLQNIVHAQTDDKCKRREIRVLKLLQQLRTYCDCLKFRVNKTEKDIEKHPVSAIGALMKFSFDADHRQAICNLGGLHAIAELIQVDTEDHGISCDDDCITLRRYAGMSLTNLTFGDGRNKSLLCGLTKFMNSLVDQLKTPCEDLRQVTASVLRNLSWRADLESKQALRNVGAVTALTIAVMEVKKESTIKSILSALWNLSAHCSLNKMDICSVPGALAFLVKMLRYKSTSNTLAIVENAGGIIRNISSHIAIREDYRQILRDNNCFEILLEQLKSSSLTIVSNACGTLWNLSARCEEDQKKLWEMGATSMLRNLVPSKHKMISMGSSAALKNLLTANPNGTILPNLDSTAKSLGLQNLPSLNFRKQRALVQEIDVTLAETCDNIDFNLSSSHVENTFQSSESNKNFASVRSDSRESIRSTKSDSVCEKLNKLVDMQDKEITFKNLTLHESLNNHKISQKKDEKQFVRRFKASMIPTPTVRKTNEEKTINTPKKVVSKEKACSDESSLSLMNDTIKDKAKIKRGIPILKTRPQKKLTAGIVSQGKATDDSLSQTQVNFPDQHCFKVSEVATLEENVNKNDLSQNCTVLQPDRKPNRTNAEEQMPNLRSKRNNLSVQNISCDYVKNIKDDSSLDRSSNVKESFSPPFQLVPTKNIDSDKEDKSKEENLTAYKTMKILNHLPKKSSAYNAKSENSAAFNKKNIDSHTTKINAEKYPSRQDSTEKYYQNIKEENQTPEIQQITQNFSALNDFSNEFDPSITRVHTPEPIEIRHHIEKHNLNDLNFPKGSEIKEHNLDFFEADKLSIAKNNSPNFQICSEITNNNFFQPEENTLCEETQNHQDSDLNCSLNSQVSCSSFLDLDDCSLFDNSNETVDFSDSETIYDDVHVKFLACNDKSITTGVNDYISLPSLGSLQNDQIDAFDLEESMVSIASLASETADVNLDQKSESDFTMKLVNGPSNREEKNVDVVIQSNVTASTLNSLRNLPASLSTDEHNMPDIEKKLTPREKRKKSQDRYKTYVIRNFKGYTLEETGNAKKVNDESFLDKSKENYFKSQFQALIAESRSLNDLNNIGPNERKEIFDNAKLVALSLKMASHDPDLELLIIRCYKNYRLQTLLPNKGVLLNHIFQKTLLKKLK